MQFRECEYEAVLKMREEVRNLLSEPVPQLVQSTDTVRSLPTRPMPQLVYPATISACSFALQRIHGAHLSSIGVTSTLRREGRSAVALATALIQRYEYGRTTLLVELDLQAPSLAKTMDLNTGPGVTDFIRGDAWIGECVQWYDDGLGVIVAGDTNASEPPLVAQVPSSSLMADVSALADVVIADLPPLPPVGYGAHLAPLCSTVLMVVRAGATPIAQIQSAVASLDHAPYVILNDVDHPAPRWLRGFVGR
jgi:Mrp family chromosome partitioning ATPase